MSGLAIGSGFAQGLSKVLLGKRQLDQQTSARREERQAQNALAAADYLIRSGRVADYSEIQPLFDLALGTGGKKSKKGEPDPHAILSQFLAPALSTPSPSTAASPAATPPAADGDASFVRRDVTSAAARAVGEPPPTPAPATPAAPPARQKLAGVSLLTDEEMTQREVTKAQTIDRAKVGMMVQTARDLYDRFKDLDSDFSMRDALRGAGFPIGVERTFAPRPIGKAIKPDDVPADATDEQGNKIDPATADFWQPIQGSRGNIYYTPGAAPTATFKPLTGQLGERMREKLAVQGLDERTATPEQLQSARDAAAKELQTERGANTASLLASRESVQALRGLQAQLAQMTLQGGGVAPAQQVAMTSNMRQEWSKAVEPFKTRQTYVAKLDEGIKMIGRDRNAATQTIINSFNRLLEEGNAVREGEYSRSEELAPLMSWLEAKVTALTEGGGKLTDAQLKSIAEEGQRIAKVTGDVHASGLADLRQAITEDLQRANIPDTRVFGTSKIGVRAAGGEGDAAARRNRARQELIKAGKQVDDATIDLFLKNNPTFK